MSDQLCRFITNSDSNPRHPHSLVQHSSHQHRSCSNGTGLEWRRYTASMDLYSEFVMYKGVDGLLQQEWTRVARVQMPKTTERPVAGAE